MKVIVPIACGDVTVRRVALAIALAMAMASCSDDGPSAATTTAPSTTASTTTTPERPASATTTAFDPTSVEGEVEAAYLASWDVYADAVYHLKLDEPALAEVYAGDALSTVISEIEERIEDQRAALVDVDHDYSVELTEQGTAVLVDQYLNHQVLIDPATKQPVEADPNERIVEAVTLTEVDGGWRVSAVTRL